jgi:hypothetical protein
MRYREITRAVRRLDTDVKNPMHNRSTRYDWRAIDTFRTGEMLYLIDRAHTVTGTTYEAREVSIAYGQHRETFRIDDPLVTQLLLASSVVPDPKTFRGVTHLLGEYQIDHLAADLWDVALQQGIVTPEALGAALKAWCESIWGCRS